MVMIELTNANDFTTSVTLDGDAYSLHFAYNDTTKSWTVDIRDGKNTDIVRGIEIVPNFPLLNQYRRHTGIPGGELMAVVSNEDKKDNQTLGRNDFWNGKAIFVYITKVERDNAMESAV